MAINYAEKYSSDVDERFSLGARTDIAVNNDYDWDGTSSIKVYSVGTTALNNYQASGSNRYGTPNELDNSVQTMLISQDKSFTYTIDRKSYDDTMMVMEAGRSLQRELDEVVIPFIDQYRLNKMVTTVGTRANATLTKTTAYSAFLDATASLDEAKVPEQGRICYVSNEYYKLLKQDESFIKRGDLAQEMLIKGQIGEVDGVAIIKGTGILPTGINFLMLHPIATTAANKLEDFFIHQNPPGINGWLIEGRVRFDAFVRNSKAAAIYPHGKTAVTPATQSE